MAEDGRYCCFVVQDAGSRGAMLKYPPLFLSSSRQKTDGESKSGLREMVSQSVAGYLATWLFLVFAPELPPPRTSPVHMARPWRERRYLHARAIQTVPR